MAALGKVRHIRATQPLGTWLRELVGRRDTLMALLWKDVRVQYGNRWLGMLWSVFQPLAYLVAAMVFMHIGGRSVPHGEVPMPLFLFSGIIVWNFLTAGVNGAANVMRTNANLITKAQFPRAYLVIAPVVRTTSDFLLATLLLMITAMIFGVPLSPLSPFHIITVITIMSCTTLAVGAMAAVAVLHQRHVAHAIPVVLYALLFVLPVFHQSDFQTNGITSYLYMMNPAAVCIRLVREMLGLGTVSAIEMAAALASSFMLLMMAVPVFRRTERTLSDML